MVKRAKRAMLLVLASGLVALSPAAFTQGPSHQTLTAQALVGFLLTTQHPQTGLLESFPRSGDLALKDVAFTYDVGVSALVLAHQGNLAAAAKALEVYRRMPLPQPDAVSFNTAYDTHTARPTLEYRLHGGPMFWVAIACLRYGELTANQAYLERGIELIEWAKAHLHHFDGGIVMGIQEPWEYILSVENNWVYYAALRIASRNLSEGPRKRALLEERRTLWKWHERNMGNRGLGDSVKALDVYTHALLVGPEAHLEDGSLQDRDRLAGWARDWIAKLNELFQVPGTARYDYTDGHEASLLGRRRAGWLEGTEQVVVAYLTWAPFFEEIGDWEFARQLRLQAALSHADVLAFALPHGAGLAIPNTDATTPFQTFMDGWMARPRWEPALNGTNWAYLAEVGYNPFTMPLPDRGE